MTRKLLTSSNCNYLTDICVGRFIEGASCPLPTLAPKLALVILKRFKARKGKEGTDRRLKARKGKEGTSRGSKARKGKEGTNRGSKARKGKEGTDRGSKERKGKEGTDRR